MEPSCWRSGRLSLVLRKARLVLLKQLKDGQVEDVLGVVRIATSLKLHL